MGIFILLLTISVFIDSPAKEPIEPGCTTFELSQLIRLEIPDNKITQICKEETNE